MISLYNNANQPVPSALAGSAAAAPRGTAATGRLLGIWRLGQLLHGGPHSQLWSAQPADSANSPRWDYVLKTTVGEVSGAAGRAASLNRLRRFGEAASMARHPHLITVVDQALESTEPFLVMPRLTGQSLADVLAAGAAQPLPVVLWFVRQTAQACAALHESGFIHGDINPTNVWISPQGQVTLMDLGSACRIGQTAGEISPGSVAYAAPQRLQMATPTAASSDLFSLGRVLWQLLSLAAKDPTSGPNIDPVADLITELVHPEPEFRPTAERLATHLMQLEIDVLGKHIRPQQQSPRRLAA